MNKFIFLTLALLTSLTLCYADVSVEATGYGANEAAAKNDALRNAVEQGAGVKIFSQTEVKDFVALKDFMISESFGMVTSYEVVGKGEKDGQVWVKVKANVSKDVKKKWEQISIVLEQKGSPSIMFCIKHMLDGQELVDIPGETQLMRKFNALGFKVVDRKMSDQTKDLQKQVNNMDQNMDSIIALTAKQGADLLVVGTFEGQFKGYDEYVVQRVLHSYAFQSKIIRTDNAQVVGATTESFSTQHPTMTFTREIAGKTGFADIVKDQYVKKMVADLLTTWIRDIQQGTLMTLVVTNVKFSLRKKILDTLRNSPELFSSVKIIHYRNNRLELEIKSKLNAEELADKIEKIEGLPLEVKELQKGTLEVKYTGQ